MDKAEAKLIAERDLEQYRKLAYDEMSIKLNQQESFERISDKGEPYQIEFDFHYDDSESRNIRVTGSISYSGWTDFFPVSSDFIIAPDGEFIGE